MNPSSPSVPDVSLRGLEARADIVVLANRNHWECYPTREPLALADLERTPDGIGLVLTVATTAPLHHLEVTGAGKAVVRTEGPVITLRFPDRDCLDSQQHDLTIVAITSAGARTPPHHLMLRFTSRARDAAAGRTGHHRITVHQCDLPLAYSRVEDWIIDAPTAADRDYARHRWAPLLAGHESPRARARALARAVIDDFEPHRGVPSDTMRLLHPFRQHERILAGIDRGWCANICEVLCLALNCCDLPARLVRMRHTYRDVTGDAPGKDFEVLLAGGHTVVEVFDDQLNQWLWLDPSQRQLGARDAGGHWLNLAEIHQRINLPSQARTLRFDHYDPASQTETTHVLAASPVADNLRHYAKREQRFYYFKRPRAAPAAGAPPRPAG